MPDATTILRKAAALCNEHSYDRKATGSVIEPLTSTFTVTGLLERAVTKPGGKVGMLLHGNASSAKAVLCAYLRTIHLDYWEVRSKPSWQEVRTALEEASLAPAEQ